MTTISQTLLRAACALSIAVALVAGPAGCDKAETLDTSLATAPALPAPMQGLWRFDRRLTLEAWARTLPDALYEQELQFVAMMDELGHPLHSDVRVQGAAIIGENGGGGVEPQYDLTQWTQQDDAITARAWWHEDRHDPGDRTAQSLILRMEDGVLWLGFGDGGPQTLWFLFKRD